MKKMKCVSLHGIGDLRLDTVPIPSCEEDEVLVKIRYCGLCGSDLPRVFSKGTYRFPTVIGHEFSGEVCYDPHGRLEGSKVAVFPLLPCFKCASCQDEKYATCKNYNYYGSRRDGGMSEYLAVKRWNLLTIPKGVSLQEGAMCEPVSVARHAVSKLSICRGDHLLISGAGPIGLIAGQWAKFFGAKEVYYFDIDPQKISFAKTIGFSEYAPGTPIDCVIEGTGHPDALTKCLEAISPGGQMVWMGNPLGPMNLTQNAYWQILRKELTVNGTWNSSYSEKENDWKESLSAMAQGTICVKPLITHVFPLKDFEKAFVLMKNKTEYYNKVMLSIQEKNDE